MRSWLLLVAGPIDPVSTVVSKTNGVRQIYRRAHLHPGGAEAAAEVTLPGD